MTSAVHAVHVPTKAPAFLARPQRRPAQAALDLQRKPLIGPVDDPLEREADRVADAIVTGAAVPSITGTVPSAARPSCPACDAEDETIRRKCTNWKAEEQNAVQRKCAGCEAEDETLRRQVDEEEEEEELQLKAEDGGPRAAGAETAAAAVARGGRPMSPAERAYFEPRFGRDLSDVRIHDDSRAGAAAKAINARAYTIGADIAFAAGQYQSALDSGRRLLAHELAHTVQQENLEDMLFQRTVDSTSTCPANVHNAPADPIAALRTVDELARTMALYANIVLVEHKSLSFDAYRNWFGLPQQTAAGAWQSRFTATFATEEEAIDHEMQTLSDHFDSIFSWLARDIRYRCPGTRRFTVGRCSGQCESGHAAHSCTDGASAIVICPAFWNVPEPMDRAQAGVLIHEAVHAALGFRLHAFDTPRARGENPGCYEGLVYELFNAGLVPGDCEET